MVLVFVNDARTNQEWTVFQIEEDAAVQQVVEQIKQLAEGDCGLLLDDEGEGKKVVIRSVRWKNYRLLKFSDSIKDLLEDGVLRLEVEFENQICGVKRTIPDSGRVGDSGKFEEATDEVGTPSRSKKYQVLKHGSSEHVADQQKDFQEKNPECEYQAQSFILPATVALQNPEDGNEQEDSVVHGGEEKSAKGCRTSDIVGTKRSQQHVLEDQQQLFSSKSMKKSKSRSICQKLPTPEDAAIVNNNSLLQIQPTDTAHPPLEVNVQKSVPQKTAVSQVNSTQQNCQISDEINKYPVIPDTQEVDVWQNINIQKENSKSSKSKSKSKSKSQNQNLFSEPQKSVVVDKNSGEICLENTKQFYISGVTNQIFVNSGEQISFLDKNQEYSNINLKRFNQEQQKKLSEKTLEKSVGQNLSQSILQQDENFEKNMSQKISSDDENNKLNQLQNPILNQNDENTMENPVKNSFQNNQGLLNEQQQENSDSSSSSTSEEDSSSDESEENNNDVVGSSQQNVTKQSEIPVDIDKNKPDSNVVQELLPQTENQQQNLSQIQNQNSNAENNIIDPPNDQQQNNINQDTVNKQLNCQKNQSQLNSKNSDDDSDDDSQDSDKNLKLKQGLDKFIDNVLDDDSQDSDKKQKFNINLEKNIQNGTDSKILKESDGGHKSIIEESSTTDKKQQKDLDIQKVQKQQQQQQQQLQQQQQQQKEKIDDSSGSEEDSSDDEDSSSSDEDSDDDEGGKTEQNNQNKEQIQQKNQNNLNNQENQLLSAAENFDEYNNVNINLNQQSSAAEKIGNESIQQEQEQLEGGVQKQSGVENGVDYNTQRKDVLQDRDDAGSQQETEVGVEKNGPKIQKEEKDGKKNIYSDIEVKEEQIDQFPDAEKGPSQQASSSSEYDTDSSSSEDSDSSSDSDSDSDTETVQNGDESLNVKISEDFKKQMEELTQQPYALQSLLDMKKKAMIKSGKKIPEVEDKLPVKKATPAKETATPTPNPAPTSTPTPTPTPTPKTAPAKISSNKTKEQSSSKEVKKVENSAVKKPVSKPGSSKTPISKPTTPKTAPPKKQQIQSKNSDGKKDDQQKSVKKTDGKQDGKQKSGAVKTPSKPPTKILPIKQPPKKTPPAKTPPGSSSKTPAKSTKPTSKPKAPPKK